MAKQIVVKPETIPLPFYRKEAEEIQWDKFCMVVDGLALPHPCEVKLYGDHTPIEMEVIDPIRCQMDLESDGNVLMSPINGHIIAIGSYSDKGKEIFTSYRIKSEDDYFNIELIVENYVQGIRIKDLGEAVTVGDVLFRGNIDPDTRLKVSMILFNNPAYKRVETYSQVH